MTTDALPLAVPTPLAELLEEMHNLSPQQQRWMAFALAGKVERAEAWQVLREAQQQRRAGL
jgi:hypothetical protein